MQILFCNDLLSVRIIYLIKNTLNIIKYVIPILLIFKISLDIYKNMLTGNQDSKESIIKKSGSRILATIIIFLVPTVVNLIFSFISKVDGSNSSHNITFATCYSEVNKEILDKFIENEQIRLNNQDEEQRKQSEIYLANWEALLKRNEENRKKNMNNNTSNYSSNLTSNSTQNSVYIENGTFYIPAYQKGKESTYSGKGCPGNDPKSKGYNNPYGYNNYFWDMLQELIKGSKQAGYNLVVYDEGCRDYDTQVRFYRDMESGRAAAPGKSKHGWGIAADVKQFYKNLTEPCPQYRNRQNCPGMAWAHDNASKYGLHFPLINANYKEDWHIEPINLKTY